MNLENRRVLVIGGGMSGIGACNLLSAVNALPVLYDADENKDRDELKRKLDFPERTRIILGELTEAEMDQTELAVISPGVAVDSPLPTQFQERGISVWGEVELAYVFSKGDVLAVTGTNGKTTTTALLGRIMEDYFEDVHIVGNIGRAYTEEALKTTPKSVTVAEISSFQLETVHTFHPKVSAILNITPDHLDRHYTMENYIAVKERIALNQTLEDTVVLNYDDKNAREFGHNTRAQALYFSRRQKLEKGVYLEDGRILYSDANTEYPVVDTSELKLLGSHNTENVMAAIGMALSYGVPLESVVKTVKAFEAVEHRIEYVAAIRGVSYYNDSKGTNTDAAIKGIQAMTRPTVLIGGGYDKHAEYDEWIDHFGGKVKCLILLGQTREKIAECARSHGFSNIVLADSLEQAVREAADRAASGDAVLLSPACASWGMFQNYEERGRLFKECVRSLKEE